MELCKRKGRKWVLTEATIKEVYGRLRERANSAQVCTE